MFLRVTRHLQSDLKHISSNKTKLPEHLTTTLRGPTLCKHCRSVLVHGDVCGRNKLSTCSGMAPRNAFLIFFYFFWDGRAIHYKDAMKVTTSVQIFLDFVTMAMSGAGGWCPGGGEGDCLQPAAWLLD